MAYTIEEQYSRDIDWYFMDMAKNMFHVTSAGGRLPKLVAENDDLNNSIHFQIQQYPRNFEIKINPNLDEIKNFASSELREMYLADFIEAAERGFISLDKTYLGDFENPMYHIVAFPINYNKEHRFDNIIGVYNEISLTQNNPFNLLDYFE